MYVVHNIFRVLVPCEYLRYRFDCQFWPTLRKFLRTPVQWEEVVLIEKNPSTLPPCQYFCCNCSRWVKQPFRANGLISFNLSDRKIKANHEQAHARFPALKHRLHDFVSGCDWFIASVYVGLAQVTVINTRSIKMDCNGPFPSSLVPLFQNESERETFHMKMSSACSFIFMQIKVIFIRMVLHLDSL